MDVYYNDIIKCVATTQYFMALLSSSFNQEFFQYFQKIYHLNKQFNYGGVQATLFHCIASTSLAKAYSSL